MRFGKMLARLHGNPVFLTLWIIVYLSLGLAIVYLWKAPLALKILVAIVVGAIHPDLDDVVAAWRQIRRKKPQ